jgi:hypothetical protein
MFSFNSIRPGSLRRHLAHSVFALFTVFCLSTGLLFTACSSDPDDGFVDDHKLNSNLIETWESEYYDAYTITDTHLSYGYGADSVEYAGTIKYVSNFNSTAGVIIIEYDAEHKPTYYDSSENYGDPDHIVLPKGDFIGIYYKDFKPGVSVQMGVAYAEGGAEKATLDEAKNAFTMGNEGTYMTYYGIYSRQ